MGQKAMWPRCEREGGGRRECVRERERERGGREREREGRERERERDKEDTCSQR